MSSRSSDSVSLPLDDDSPFEVRSWIISVLLAPPALCDDEEAEKLAGRFHGSGLDLKTASCGDLQAASCLGPRAGLRVFERIDGSQGGFESIMSSLKQTTKSWGFDWIPSDVGSPNASRKGSIAHAPSDHSVEDASRRSQPGSKRRSMEMENEIPLDSSSVARKASVVELRETAGGDLKHRRRSSQLEQG